jgi:transposase InsO family protein
MKDPNYFHWPTSSVWALALRSKEVAMARSTWYKYVGNFDLKRTKVSKKYKPKKKALRAASKNQVWHADVSVYKTLDNVKYYIYTVVDNFSRMILAWDIDTKLSAQIRLRSIQRAIEQQFDVKLSNQSVDLIVDGGSENNNQTIHDFIQNNRVNINKKIALKDIIQSNSMIEATYKIMKYRYFYAREILSSAMRAQMEFFVHDYNEVRPHHHHLYKTPFEVHNDIEPIEYKKIINQAIKERVMSNRQQTCDLNCQLVKN